MEAEIVVEGRRRRQWPKELKLQIVEESYARDVSVCDVARRYDLDPAQLYSWRKAFREGCSSGAAFVPVAVSESCAAAIGDRVVEPRPLPDCLEVMLRNGRRVSAPLHVDPALLCRFVAALDEG